MTRNTITITLLATALLVGACGPSAWDEARDADTIASLEAFVQQNPDSEFVDQANSRIRNLWQLRWEEVSAVNTLEGYVDFARSGATGDELAATRDAVIAQHDEASGPRGNVEMSGMFGSSGMIENVEAIATRYDGLVAGMPATVAYSVMAGANAAGEQQYFAFRDGDNVLSIRSDADVAGTVEIESGAGGSIRYELFGLVKAPDDDLVGSFLVGKGPDILWSNVAGMTLAGSASGAPQRQLIDGEAVLFAVHDSFGLVYVP